jgi:hypothetical protein
MAQVPCGGGRVVQKGEFDPIEADRKMGMMTANLMRNKH